MNILFISPTLPTFDRDSGSFRLFQIIQLCRKLGHNVTFIARSAAYNNDPRPYIDKLEEIGVTVYPVDPAKLRSMGLTVNFPDFDFRKLMIDGNFDVAYLYFYRLAEQYLDDIRFRSPKTKIIIDSVDVHFLREQRAALLHKSPELLSNALETQKNELSIYRRADMVIAVTDEDRQVLLQQNSELNVGVIPNIHPIMSSILPFRKRLGILFIGGFLHIPNVDAVLYFYTKVWPIIKESLPDAVLFVVGNKPPAEIQALAGPDVTVTGFVPDTKPYLDKCRVSVAPLRYGAGMKGKVGEALAAGLPVVASPVAVEGTNLRSGTEVFVADDPAEFAAAVVKLHEDEAVWNTISSNGRRFISDNYSPAAVLHRVSDVLMFFSKQHKTSKKTLPPKQLPSFIKIGSYSDYLNFIHEYNKELELQRAYEESLCTGEHPFTVLCFCHYCQRELPHTVTYKYSYLKNGKLTPNWREHLICPSCNLSNRSRAVLHLFEHLCSPKNNSTIYLTEQVTTLYKALSHRYPRTIGSEFLGDNIQVGLSDSRGIRNEDITKLSFPDNSFDFVLTFDVLEYVYDVAKAFEECFRVLTDGGSLFFTVPFCSERQVSQLRAVVGANGQRQYLMPPEYHGNPLNDNGCLTFHNFGWDITDMLRKAGFTAPTSYFVWSQEYGYLGDNQVVFVASKQGGACLTSANDSARPHEAYSRQIPSVSIVIPLFNNVELSASCIDKLFKNTPADLYELILVDNGSTDRTQELLAIMPPSVKVIRNQQNQGFAKACNQGAQSASGKYLLFLNNDTEPLQGWLEPLVSILDTDPEVAAVGAKLLYPDNTLQHAGVLVSNHHTTGDLIRLGHIYCGEQTDLPAANVACYYQSLTAACLMVRKEAFEAVGGFDEQYWNGFEDVELCFKLGLAGWKLVYELKAYYTILNPKAD